MAARQSSGSLLSAFVVVVVLVFLIGVYLVVAVPTIDGVADSVRAADDGAIQSQGLDGSMSWVLTVGLVLGPTILGMGVVLYLLAVVAGKGAFRGGGLR